MINLDMRNLIFVFCFSVILFASSCSKSSGENTGTEYMPDMYHSIAYEANLYDYYYYNTWGTEDEYYKSAQPRKPVKGTIPRGAAGGTSAKFINGTASKNAIAIPASGHVPYYYENTEEERTRASAEIINNPFPITDHGLESGADLYTKFCAICHGDKGDGNGWLVDEANPAAAYPAAPAVLTDTKFVTASNGQLYHAIIHGKNVMGGYGDKMSYEERWNVIHHIRALQATATEKEYNANINTLNNIDIPFAQVKQVVEHTDVEAHTHDGHSEHHGAEHNGTEHHGEHHDAQHKTDHGHGDDHSGGH